MFPIYIQFFDYEIGVENHLFDFVECNDENSEKMPKIEKK